MTVGTLVPEGGGPSRTVTALADAVARSGCPVDLVSVNLGREFGPPLVPPSDGVRTELVPVRRMTKSLSGYWAPGFGRAVRARLAGEDRAILHDHGIWLPTNHAAVRAAVAQGAPIVVSPRGMLRDWAMRQRAWKKKVAWRLYQERDLRAARVLHATSEEEAGDLRRFGLRQPIALIPNGVDLRPYPRRSPAAGCDRTLLFLSRLHPKKGLLDLVRAWASVLPPGWRVVVAGPDEGGHRAQVEADAKAAGVFQDFAFVGQVSGEAKWRLVEQADLFVLPTHGESFGVVVAEALGCGIPVITTKAAPWRELETDRCGWWIDVGVEPLAAAIRDATSRTDAEREEMGSRGRELVERRYGWSGIAASTISVYEWSIAGGKMPACVIS